jgi:DNA-binding FadR family transcriptional regulator
MPIKKKGKNMVIKIKQNTIMEQVLRNVKELIANGTFKVGDKIPTEVELTQMFGVGRSSVREALKILQYLGIVQMHPSKGTFVCDCSNLSREVVSWAILLGKRDFFELMGVRGAIESSSIRTLFSREDISDIEWTDLTKNLKSCWEKMITTDSIDVFIAEDYRFHETIIKYSNNSIFIDVYHTLRSFMHEEIKRCFFSAAGNHLDKVHNEHASILRFIEEKKPEKAYEWVTTHLNNIDERVRDSFTKNKS